MYETEIGYAIYQISEDGLLKRPKNSAGYNLFYDYETMNEVIRAIEEIEYSTDYVVLTTVSRVYKF